jgi:hypothetical protein
MCWQSAKSEENVGLRRLKKTARLFKTMNAGKKKKQAKTILKLCKKRVTWKGIGCVAYQQALKKRTFAKRNNKRGKMQKPKKEVDMVLTLEEQGRVWEKPHFFNKMVSFVKS